MADQGVHLTGLTLPGAYSARGAGGHHLLVIPQHKLVIVHRGDNEPATHAIEDVSKAGMKPGTGERQFAELVKRSLAARGVGAD